MPSLARRGSAQVARGSCRFLPRMQRRSPLRRARRLSLKNRLRQWRRKRQFQNRPRRHQHRREARTIARSSSFAHRAGKSCGRRGRSRGKKENVRIAAKSWRFRCSTSRPQRPNRRRLNRPHLPMARQRESCRRNWPSNRGRNRRSPRRQRHSVLRKAQPSRRLWPLPQSPRSCRRLRSSYQFPKTNQQPCNRWLRSSHWRPSLPCLRAATRSAAPIPLPRCIKTQRPGLQRTHQCKERMRRNPPHLPLPHGRPPQGTSWICPTRRR